MHRLVAGLWRDVLKGGYLVARTQGFLIGLVLFVPIGIMLLGGVLRWLFLGWVLLIVLVEIARRRRSRPRRLP